MVIIPRSETETKNKLFIILILMLLKGDYKKAELLVDRMQTLRRKEDNYSVAKPTVSQTTIPRN